MHKKCITNEIYDPSLTYINGLNFHRLLRQKSRSEKREGIKPLDSVELPRDNLAIGISSTFDSFWANELQERKDKNKKPGVRRGRDEAATRT